MCYAAADINLDGRVDLSDESAWLALLQMGGLNPVTGEPDRRMDLNGDGEVTEADFALWGPLFEQACKRPNEVGAMVDDGPFNGVAEGGVLTVPTRRGTHSGGTWVMHGVDNRFGFAGYMWDPFLKLYHVRHRVYDPMSGRWLQRDPIGMAGGWNLYQYCGGEPWGYVDPMGLWSLNRWLWTGDGNASDEVYNSALSAGASTIPTFVVRAADAVDTTTGRRVVGGVQAVGGASIALVGGATSALGVGVPVAAVGVDMLQAGVRQTISGEWEETVAQKIFVSAATAAGVHPDDVPLVAGVATALVQGGAGGVAAGLTPVNGSFKLQGRGGAKPAGGQSCGPEGKGTGTPDAAATMNPGLRAANKGNLAHYDELNGGTGRGLPTALQEEFPNTVFEFARRGQKGPDVTVRDGVHPSLYEGSRWPAGVNTADFKPGNPSGLGRFASEIRSGKLPPGTIVLPYDPDTLLPRWTLWNRPGR